MTKDEAQKSLLCALDTAASAAIAEYPTLAKLDIFNTLQLLSWKIVENQPSLASTAILKRSEGVSDNPCQNCPFYGDCEE